MDNDIPAVRKLRIEVVTIPWLVVTTLILILLIYFWVADNERGCPFSKLIRPETEAYL